MSTKFFSDGEVHSYFNPFDTPYEAFINYMNILGDFEIRLNAALKTNVDDQVTRLSKIIQEKEDQLKRLEKQLAGKKPARIASPKPSAAKVPVRAETVEAGAAPQRKRTAAMGTRKTGKKNTAGKKSPSGKKSSGK